MKFNEAVKVGASHTAGKYDFGKMSYQEVVTYLNSVGMDIEKEIINFKQNWQLANRKVKKGWTKRKDMPVVNTVDTPRFKKDIEAGRIDHKKPFAPGTDQKNLFPDMFTAASAGKFLMRGLKDGSIKDDQIKVIRTKMKVKDITPIQSQIYLDIAMRVAKDEGIATRKSNIENRSVSVVSKSGHLIDGHHRYLSAMLIDPDIMTHVLMIDLPIRKLIDMAMSFGFAIGNKRNL